jgi:hypothetical protein
MYFILWLGCILRHAEASNWRPHLAIPSRPMSHPMMSVDYEHLRRPKISLTPYLV